ncbi:hypothetical protein HDV05_007588 [Chytridiales sp. JEL 0842]|nr:hypothetical protein HDV05_007588 [Chytridiales sp. JEL 0842]
MLQAIMEHLSLKDLIEASHVSRHWHQIASSPNLWRNQSIGLTAEGILLELDHAGKRSSSMSSKNFNSSDCTSSTDPIMESISSRLKMYRYSTNTGNNNHQKHSRHQPQHCFIPISPTLYTKFKSSMLHIQHLTSPHKDLQDHHLEQCLPYFPNLRSINLEFCDEFTGESLFAPSKMSRLTGLLMNLETLCLARTRVTDEVLKSIVSQMPNLKNLDVSFCRRLTDRGLKYICSSTEPASVSSTQTNTKETPSTFLSRLQSLKLAGCPLLTGFGIHRALLMLASTPTPSFFYLDLSHHCLLTPEIISIFVSKRRQTRLSHPTLNWKALKIDLRDCRELTADEIEECVRVDEGWVEVAHNAMLKNYTPESIKNFLDAMYGGGLEQVMVL